MANIEPVSRKIRNGNPAPRRFQLILAVAMVLALTECATAQSKPPTAPNTTVELRIQLSWWGASSLGGPRKTTMTLQPLDSTQAANAVQVSEGVTTIIRLTRGRYQLTTIDPIVVNGQAYGWSIELPLVEPTNQLRLSQENAVRLSSAAIAYEQNVSLGPATTASATADDDTRRQISALLSRWTASLKSHDLKAQMSCYAPRLATYFRQHNVSHERVQQDKQNLFQRYPNIRRLELSNVHITTQASQPEATAVKTWIFSGGEADWRGQAITYFSFQKIRGHWAISSESEHLTAEGEPVTQSSVVGPTPRE
jgi:hypothetical protein